MGAGPAVLDDSLLTGPAKPGGVLLIGLLKGSEIP